MVEERDLSSLPGELRLVFAPLDKRAFGFAIGVWAGLVVFGATAYHLLLDDWLLERIPFLSGREYSGQSLWLLAQYFRGYDPTTWTGAVIGGLWGLWTGFVTGWFVAFVRNLAVASWLFVVKTKSRLEASREFLDHI